MVNNELKYSYLKIRLIIIISKLDKEGGGFILNFNATIIDSVFYLSQ